VGILGTVLKMLDSRVGTFALTSGLTTQAFTEADGPLREKILLSFINSPIAAKRLIHKVFRALSLSTFYGLLDADKRHIVHDVTGYPIIDPSPAPEVAPARLPVITSNQLPTNESYDVIVVGSGCGGGNAAQQVALKGYKVLVIDKGAYIPNEEMGLPEKDAMATFYEKSGLLGTEDGSVSILAASTVGGGSVINWSACLRLQGHAREEWANKFGLKWIQSSEFEKCMDEVAERMGVNTCHTVYNKPNSILLDGCAALGFHAGPVPQNTGAGHNDGSFCHLGCREGGKQSTPLTFLKDAVENGAQVLEKTFVSKVVVEHGKATGVEIVVDGQKRVIKSKMVIVSGGSLWTPVILKNSGLRNKHIGSNLRLHPATVVLGQFPDEKEVRDKEGLYIPKVYAGPINAWEGNMLTTVSNTFENVAGDGYGAKIECPTVHPGLLGGLLPWRGGVAHKQTMLNFQYMSPLVLIARDKDSVGSVDVTHNQDGTSYPKLHFAVSSTDEKSLVEATVGGAKILLAAGAKMIETTLCAVEPYHRKDKVAQDGAAPLDFLQDPDFAKWCAAVRSNGYLINRSAVASAHQMGSCRMAASSGLGAVKPDGETWEVKNLFVADTSLFPTASGVNPMITAMAMSNYVGKNVVAKLAQGKL
jgi:choline dehydrogenase-like flavoprotein